MTCPILNPTVVDALLSFANQHVNVVGRFHDARTHQKEFWKEPSAPAHFIMHETIIIDAMAHRIQDNLASSINGLAHWYEAGLWTSAR